VALYSDVKEVRVFYEDEGELTASADLMKRGGDCTNFCRMPMPTVVSPTGLGVSVFTVMKVHTGTRDKPGQPDISS
jgi:hypothetical protein